MNPVKHDPRASIGTLDCEGLTVPVTLDNTRSTEATRFLVFASDDLDQEEPQAQSVVVPALAAQTVQVPVVDGRVFFIDVNDADAPDGDDGFGASLADDIIVVACAPNARNTRATIGALDCATVTVPVTLDNSAATEASRFEVFSGDPETERTAFEKTVTLPAGATRVLQVPVLDHSRVIVGVGDADIAEASDGQDGTLAIDQIEVACRKHEPAVRRGALTCPTLRVPLTLDNTKSEDATEFGIAVVDPSFEHVYYDEVIHVPAGATTNIQVAVPRGRNVLLDMYDADLGVEIAPEAFIAVGCPAARAIPDVAVLGEKLPQTGGFNTALPLTGAALLMLGGVLMAGGRKQRRR